MRLPASMLLMMPEVQKELNITDAQKTQMQTLRDNAQKDIRAACRASTSRPFGT